MWSQIPISRGSFAFKPVLSNLVKKPILEGGATAFVKLQIKEEIYKHSGGKNLKTSLSHEDEGKLPAGLNQARQSG